VGGGGEVDVLVCWKLEAREEERESTVN